MAIHEKYIRLINAELDGDISRAEQGELDAHLTSCAPCALERENLHSVTLAFGEAARLQVPSGFNATVMSALRGAGALQTAPRTVRPVWRWLGVAAVVIGILPTLGLTLLLGQPVLRYIRDFAVWCVTGISDTVLNSAALLKASSAFSDATSALSGFALNLADHFVGQAMVTHIILVVCVAFAIGGYMLLSRTRGVTQTTI